MTNIYAAPAPLGNNANSGLSVGAPKTLSGASALSAPGDTVYLLGGTYALASEFNPAHSGTADNWITYRNYDSTPPILLWTGGVTGHMIHVFSTVSSDLDLIPRYFEFHGITMDGSNRCLGGVFIQHSAFIRIINCVIKNMGGAGVSTKFADYIFTQGCQIYHNGYETGWSSAISYNSHQWHDHTPGFHSFVLNNIISGTYDGSEHHTDGNGIIMDLSNNTHDDSSADTPPVLIANNVVFENGGRGIHCLTVSNIWVVNNTCYKNGLDLLIGGGQVGNFSTNSAKNCYFINNISYAWTNHYNFEQSGSFNDTHTYYKNLHYEGAGLNFTPSSPGEWIHADPLFLDPPPVDPTDDGQYAGALAPWNLASKLTLQSGSPAIDAGIDPSALVGIPAEIAAALALYVSVDILGVPRPTGAAFDLGAYEFVSVGSGGGTPPFGLDQYPFEPTGYDGFTNQDKMRMLSIEGFDGPVASGTSEAIATVIFQSLALVTTSPSLAALATVEFVSSAIVSSAPGEAHALFPKS